MAALTRQIKNVAALDATDSYIINWRGRKQFGSSSECPKDISSSGNVGISTISYRQTDGLMTTLKHLPSPQQPGLAGRCAHPHPSSGGPDGNQGGEKLFFLLCWCIYKSTGMPLTPTQDILKQDLETVGRIVLVLCCGFYVLECISLDIFLYVLVP